MFRKSKVVCFCFVITAVVCISSAACAQSGTITGTVYSSYELVADDGIVYLVTADDMGEELMELDGNRVSVTGIIDELGGEYAITVTRFKMLPDDLQEQEQEEEPLDEESFDEEPLDEEFPEEDLSPVEPNE